MKKLFLVLFVSVLIGNAVADDIFIAEKNNVSSDVEQNSAAAAVSPWQDDSVDEIVIGEDDISNASNIYRGEADETVVRRRRLWLPVGINLPSLNISSRMNVNLPDVNIKFPSVSRNTVYRTTYVSSRFYPHLRYRKVPPLRRFRPVPPRVGPLRRPRINLPPAKGPKRKFSEIRKTVKRPSKVVPPKRKR